MPAIHPALLCLIAFFLGAIPFGLLMGKLRGVDLREHGSGNIGATNTLRVLGKVPGAMVLLLDALKGYAPVALAQLYWRFSAEWVVGIALCAVLGHIYSPYIRFRGGKGVATGLGVLFALSWQIALATLVVFGSGFWVSKRTVAVGSVLATAAQVGLFWALKQPLAYCLFSTIAGAFIIWRHRSNLQRLLAGSENRL